MAGDHRILAAARDRTLVPLLLALAITSGCEARTAVFVHVVSDVPWPTVLTDVTLTVHSEPASGTPAFDEHYVLRAGAPGSTGDGFAALPVELGVVPLTADGSGRVRIVASAVVNGGSVVVAGSSIACTSLASVSAVVSYQPGRVRHVWLELASVCCNDRLGCAASSGSCGYGGCRPVDRDAPPSCGCSVSGDEQCNGFDDDCDCATDEGVLLTFLRDADGDGIGTATDAMSACMAPPGYVSDAAGSDCDDANASIHPGAAEVCDGVDQDCDGLTDEGVQSTLYVDADRDGYGVGASFLHCPGTGFAARSGDCNDANAAVHPGATESCNAVDDDCSGGVDEDPVCLDCIDMPDMHLFPFVRSGGSGSDLDCCNDGPMDWPRFTVYVDFATTTGTDVAVQAHATASEETGDLTSGHLDQSTSRSIGRRLSVLSPRFTVQYLDHEHDLADDAIAEAILLERGDGAITGVTCLGDTVGDDICPDPSCTWCDLSVGCVRVRYLP